MPKPPIHAWPRGLSAELAAVYVGLSQTKWLDEFRAGRTPPRVQLTPGRYVWLIEDLDRWLDAKAGRASHARQLEADEDPAAGWERIIGGFRETALS